MYADVPDPVSRTIALSNPHLRAARIASIPAPTKAVGAVPAAADSKPPNSGPMALPAFRQDSKTPMAAPRFPAGTP